MYRKFVFEYRIGSWRGPFIFTFGNFEIEIFAASLQRIFDRTGKRYGWVTERWPWNNGCCSRHVGFAGLVIHIIPDVAAYLDNDLSGVDQINVNIV